MNGIIGDKEKKLQSKFLSSLVEESKRGKND